MKVGDSFFSTSTGSRMAAHCWGKRHGHLFTTRTIIEKGKKGYRIWLTK